MLLSRVKNCGAGAAGNIAGLASRQDDYAGNLGSAERLTGAAYSGDEGFDHGERLYSINY